MWSEREETPLISLYDVAEDKVLNIALKPQESPREAFARYSSSLKAANSGNASNVNKGYVAVMNVNGPMIKYGDMCTYGMDEMADTVNDMKADKDIIGLISLCDSPGGQIAGLQNLSQAVKNFGKPTIALVNDGISASANYWYAASHDKIYTTSSTCEVGSIGVLCTLYDNEKALKKIGYKKITVYSRLSSEKNADYQEALKGNLDPMKDNLDAFAKEFHNHVEANRTLTDKKVLDGAMYMSAHAIELGLVDGQKSLNEAIDEIVKDSGRSSGNSASKLPIVNAVVETTNEIIETNDDMKLFDSIKGKKANEITAEDLVAITAGLTEAGITGIEIHTEGTVAALQTKADGVTDLKAQVDSLNEKFAALNEPEKETKVSGDDTQHAGGKKDFVPVIKP